MKKILTTKLVCLFFVTLIFACSEEDGVIGTGEKPSNTNGTAQKGPFVKNSEVTIATLTALGNRTDTTINTKTLDDLGNFDFLANNGALYDIAINGFYYNELSGISSTQPISLHALYLKSPTDHDQVYVNILTHLINQRILYLIQNGDSVDAAFKAAQNELLFFIHDAIFIINLQDINFTNLSVYNLENTDELGNALLLYVTTNFYQTAATRASENNSDVDLELEILLQTIAADLKSDGKVTDLTVINELRNATHLLDPEQIKNNLTQYSLDKLGISLSVPDINLVLDSDRDGITNSMDLDDDGDGIPDTEDQNPYLFELLTTPNETFSVTSGVNSIIRVNYNKPENSEFSVTTAISPLHGNTFTIGDDLYYRSNKDYVGPDEFSYQVKSRNLLLGDFSSVITAVKINVLAP